MHPTWVLEVVLLNISTKKQEGRLKELSVIVIMLEGLAQLFDDESLKFVFVK